MVKINLEDGQCWQSETRQKKYEASGLEFKKSQLWITLPNRSTPGGCTVFLQGKEAKKDAGTTFTQSSFHLPSGLTPVENTCVDHHRVSMDTEFPFGTARELKFINSFYCLILLFCGAQLQILYTRVHKVSFLFATAVPKKWLFATTGKEQCKKCTFDYSSYLCPEVTTHEYAGINITVSIC